MKTIEPVSIWDNGVDRQAKILNAYCNNLYLNNDATFVYSLYETNEEGFQWNKIREGVVYMNPEEYAKWQTDDVAWDYIALKLNLTITGDYVPPVPKPPTPEITEPNI